MNVFLVHAHPEPRSLNGSLKDFMVGHLRRAGHAVEVSDLYAMHWKAQIDAADSLEAPVGPHFHPSLDSKHAYVHGVQSADIAAEQDKLRWADALPNHCSPAAPSPPPTFPQWMAMRSRQGKPARGV